MITPSPTTKIDPRLARGVLKEIHPGHIVLEIPNTSYAIHLIPHGLITAEPGKRIIGKVRTKSRRIDIVKTGGRFIEPVFGKPRRMQGTVTANEGGSLVVDVTIPVTVEPGDARQKAADFPVGTLVAFDLPEWPTFAQV
jgi:hypothetical protein